MKKYLLTDKANNYKANLHVHTTVSDGDFTPEEIKAMYVEKGYSVVAFTDHEVMVPHPELTDDSFLAITATEISTNERNDCDFFFTKTYHLNIYSPYEDKKCFAAFDKSKMWLKHSFEYITPEQEKAAYSRLYNVDDVNKVIKMANDEGCLVSYNHPVWSQQDFSDYAELRGLWGIELYNTACARNGYFDSEKPLDDLLRRGERIFPLAADDAHKACDCFGGFTVIRADELTYGKIFEALKKGDFYASVGPEIHEISIDGSVVSVKCSPVVYIGLSTDCRQLYAKRDEKNLLTEADFDINWYFDLSKNGPNENKYIRITLVDNCGNEAYSRAYFMDELINDD